jgi:glycosyltransferase involved in cell wall biosynthesis
VPVVATNSSSLPEVVGDAGLLAEPGDAGALAGHIHRLLENPDRAAAMAERGIRQAAKFRWERTAEAMETLFLEVIREALEDQ